MSEENASEGRRLDRRGFLGAAAGVAVVGAAATPIAWAKKMEAAELRRGRGEDPEGAARRDSLHAAGAGLEHEGAVRGLDRLLQGTQLQRLGVRGRLPDGRRHQPQQRQHALPRRAPAGRALGWDRARELREDVRLPPRRHARRALADERGEPRQRAHEDERVGLQPARRRQRLPERGDQPAGRRHGDHESERDLGVAGERRTR